MELLTNSLSVAGSMTTDSLPRLLYIGDVPIEASYHGSTLLYRLLQDYPLPKLSIIEGNLFVSQTDRRLPGVEYHHIRVGNQRYLNTRFHNLVSSWLSWTAASRVRQINKLLANFEPEAVLTVAHGYSWLTAARFAQNNHLPLHLIIHDDWPRITSSSNFLHRWIDSEFARVYRQAVSRLSVSPFMAEEYEKRYGVPASVLYPSRAKNMNISTIETSTFKEQPNRPLTVVFGGTVNSVGYCRALKSLAECLQSIDGQLVIYGPLTKEQAINSGLQSSNIHLGGLLPADQFRGRIREEADILFVPMSFASQDKANMQISFPSKLTDYTAVGLPLLIYGPSYCSAVRWATENPNVAEVVTSEEPQELALALERLRSKQYRADLANVAVLKGNDFFSHTKVQGQFFAHLLKA